LGKGSFFLVAKSGGEISMSQYRFIKLKLQRAFKKKYGYSIHFYPNFNLYKKGNLRMGKGKKSNVNKVVFKVKPGMVLISFFIKDKNSCFKFFKSIEKQLSVDVSFVSR
jgi:ribosomal protein L16/L10AE